MNLDNELRAALRREPAPPDFAARVLAKTTLAKTTLAKTTLAKTTPKMRVLPFPRRPLTFAVAAALAVAALIPPAVYQYQRHQRAIEARDQLIVALSITKV